MNNLLVKPITEMTPQEIELMQVQLTQARLSDIQKQLEFERNERIKLNTKIDLTNDEVESIKIDVNNLHKNFNILSAEIYATQRDQLINAKNKRIYQLLGDTLSDAYIVFGSFFHSKIWADLKKYLGYSYKNINMDNWEDPNSDYQKALSFMSTWTPSRTYFDSKYCSLLRNYYNSTLKSNVATAFSRFMIQTNNGASVEFVKGGIR